MFCILAALVAASASDDAVGATQFAYLIRAEHGLIKDIAFVYEGKLVWVGPSGILKMDPSRFEAEFQGTCLFRSDGAEMLDIYRKGSSDSSSVSHEKMALLHDRYETYHMTPDLKGPDGGPVIQTAKGHSGSVSDPFDPHQLLYLSFFRMMPDPEIWGYQFQGWEDVDGNRCLKVRFNYSRDPKSPTFSLFWIDMSRGGHPLKVEHYHDSRLYLRCKILEIIRLPGAGPRSIWLPTQCQLDGFQWETSYYSKPVHRQTVSMVYASILVNVGLPDSLFTVKGKGGLPDIEKFGKIKQEAGELALRREFDQAPPPPLPRNDPATVRKVLEERLAEAEQQSKVLLASSPARESWSWTTILQAGFVATGILILGGAAAFTWRRR